MSQATTTPRPWKVGSPDSGLVLDIRGLSVDYGFGEGAAHAVRGVDLTLRRGEVLGIAGESGSGKSTLAYAMTRLLRPPGEVVGGTVRYFPEPDDDGAATPFDVLAATPEALRRFRWEEVAVVFQAAMSSLNPVLPVAVQLTDTIAAHRPRTRRSERARRAGELLELVGIDADRLSAYPHQLSGGQRQRVMIAMALALDPRVLIMDEPTTSLDVVVQRAILNRLMDLRARLNCSVVFITHDLSLLLELADRIAVMYAGKVVEIADSESLRRSPLHPYTSGLLSSFPVLRGPQRTLAGIPGSPPDLRHVPPGCAFHPRCGESRDRCGRRGPQLVELTPGREVACLLRTDSADSGGTVEGADDGQ